MLSDPSPASATKPRRLPLALMVYVGGAVLGTLVSTGLLVYWCCSDPRSNKLASVEAALNMFANLQEWWLVGFGVFLIG